MEHLCESWRRVRGSNDESPEMIIVQVDKDDRAANRLITNRAPGRQAVCSLRKRNAKGEACLASAKPGRSSYVPTLLKAPALEHACFGIPDQCKRYTSGSDPAEQRADRFELQSKRYQTCGMRTALYLRTLILMRSTYTASKHRDGGVLAAAASSSGRIRS